MSPVIGTRLGPYEITAKLGEGGMGEVYRATDSKLKRQVAIKVLPAAFTEDKERLARFEREAQLLARLHHPNIASIFGLEEADGVRALVMELVEGEDLSARIARGPLPLDQALPVARQIAEALEAAHERGIVHRDLKPANVKVRHDGTVKVLDFGLAVAMETSTGSSSAPATSPALMNSPTLTAIAGTQLGVILGTAAYMAPEQARGGALDKRADIWAFGVVLYEMLTGKSLFAAATVSDTLAGVLLREIDFGSLPAATPPAVRRLLARCLERDANQRLRDIGEARIEIGRVERGTPGDAGTASPGAVGPRAARRQRAAWFAVAALGLLALALGARPWASREDGAERRSPVRLAFLPPDGVLADEGGFDATVVAPDGKQLVFAGRLPGQRRRLWLRSLDRTEARALPDTEDAIEPFWSPDSRSIGFGAGGKLKRIDLAGGNAQILADAARLNGGAWSRDGVIVYSPDYNSGLYRVPAQGGERELLRQPDPERNEGAYNNPGFLPDGRRYYFRAALAAAGPGRYLVASLDSDEVVPLIEDVSSALFAPPHWLLYARNEALSAQRLDLATLALRGEPVLVGGGLTTGTGFNSSRYSVSDDGVFVLRQPREHLYQLAWFDRSGRRLGNVGAVAKVGGSSQTPTLSPDGRRVAIARADAATRNHDLWTIDLERGIETRLTTDPGFDQLPIWSPDGGAIYFTRRGLFRMSAAGGGEQLLAAGTYFAKEVSPDGRFLTFGVRGQSTRADIWALPLDSGSTERKPLPLLEGPFSEYEPRLSPDGRWLAYNSDVTGRDEIYVRPLAADWKIGAAIQVSASGGQHPRWRRDGKELFFVSAPASLLEGRLMAASVRTVDGRFEAAVPVELFPVAMFPSSLSGEYDVAADGQRFLVATIEGVTSPSSVTLILDWDAELPR